MNLKQILQSIDTLKPIPQVTFQLLELAEDPDSDVSEITQLIVHDAVITAKLLRIANSAYYGFSRKIESIQDAVVLLGLNSIIQLALMQVAAVNLKDAYDGYGLSQGELWEHSASSAILAKMIAEKLQLTNVNLVFTAALLKDIGKVVLNQQVMDMKARIQAMAYEDKIGYMEAEKKALGIDHAELGAMIAKRWNFTHTLIDIIKDHHLTDARGVHRHETCAVYLADNLCSMMGIGTGTDGLVYRFNNDIVDRFELGQLQIDRLIMDFAAEKHRLDELIRSF